MHRLLFLLALMSLCISTYSSIHGHRYSYHHRRWHYRRHDRRFDRLSAHVIAADRYLQGFCKDNTNCDAYDIYESDGYRLSYNIPQCSVDYISVKIKHRVLYMTARQTISYHPSIFVDMRILPDLLLNDEASWTYNSGRLDITIPYKKDFKSQWDKTCGNVDTRVIDVPQWGFQFRNRFGEDKEETTDLTIDENDIDNTPDTGVDPYDTPDLLNFTTSTTSAPVSDNKDRLIFSPLQ